MPHSSHESRPGYTLIELLIVAQIVAVVMAVALPIYLGATSSSDKKACRANMQWIANAAQTWKDQCRSSSFVALKGTDLSVLSGDLGACPKCPDGGTYSISTVGSVTDTSGRCVSIPQGGLAVTCDVADHGSFVPGMTPR